MKICLGAMTKFEAKHIYHKQQQDTLLSDAKELRLSERLMGKV